MLLEAYMRRHSRAMGTKILDPYKNMNTPYDHPVLIQWGSNSIECERDDLEDLVDMMEDENVSPNGFLQDAWMPFLRQHADKAQ
jgi:hypothetical protein